MWVSIEKKYEIGAVDLAVGLIVECGVVLEAKTSKHTASDLSPLLWHSAEPHSHIMSLCDLFAEHGDSGGGLSMRTLRPEDAYPRPRKVFWPYSG